MRKFIFTILLILMASSAFATTYYVRTDGGTKTQCTGTTDAAYPGSGTGQSCAFKHPFEALGTQDGAISQTITGGDIVIIKNGTYRIGYESGVYDTTTAYDDCETAYPWECQPKTLPSTVDYEVTSITNANPAVVTTGTFSHGYSNGMEIYLDFAVNTGGTLMEEINGQWYTVANATSTTFELSGVDSTNFGTYSGNGTVTIPTRIYGEEWDSGCANKPELYGAERVDRIFQLNNSDNVHIKCLELTDHEECFRLTSNSVCNESSFPYGDWASSAIKVTQSRNAVVKDVDVKGLAENSIKSGKQNHNERWENVNVIGGLYGWVGDYVGNSAAGQANTGQRIFKNLNAWWMGCPANATNTQVGNCCGQATYAPCGGADGFVSTPNDTADYTILDSSFGMNISDGADLVYTMSGTIRISRSLFFGNAGNSTKMGTNAFIENSIFFNSCKSAWAGRDFNDTVDYCRSNGDIINVYYKSAENTGDDIHLLNNTFLTESTYMLYIEDEVDGTDNCNGDEYTYVRNNIFLGFDQYDTPGTKTSFYGISQGDCSAGELKIDYDNSNVYDVLTSPCPESNMDCTDPLLTTTPTMNLLEYNPTITTSSPAYNATVSTDIPFQYGGNDFNNNPPSGTRDWGALEYGSTGFDFTEFMTYINGTTAETLSNILKSIGAVKFIGGVHN